MKNNFFLDTVRVVSFSQGQLFVKSQILVFQHPQKISMTIFAMNLEDLEESCRKAALSFQLKPRLC